MPTKLKIGEILVKQEIISPAQLSAALKKQKALSLPLCETLVQMKFVSENIILEILSKHLNTEFLDISENDFQIVDMSLTGVLPVEVCKQLMVLPVFLLEDAGTKKLTLAMSNPLNGDAIKEVENLSRTRVTPLLTTSTAITGGIQRLFADRSGVPAITAELEASDNKEAVRYVNKMLIQAVEMGASDIHIEPHAKEVHVRYRVDGVLNLINALPANKIFPIVSRIKVMGSGPQSLMRIDKKMVPQDGSFARVIGGHAVDFRVSTFPTIQGEKVVLRVLDKDSVASMRQISDLKMPPGIERRFTHCIKQSSGIIIATGPTGSGKSTTLYTAINSINNVDINIVTIEDPVEYHVGDYVNQSSLNPEAGYTYPLALKSIMRQDPDVILIGEIRDFETAEIAIQAALTGHLVFTTLHTDDSAGAIVRLVDLGIEQFLVSSTVVSAVNQRLLRKVCPHCREAHSSSMEEMVAVGVAENIAETILMNIDKYHLSKGRGCSSCNQTGYLGRQGAFELLTITPVIKKLILAKETSDVIAETAREKEKINMLFEDGLRLVLSGVTTFEELRRIPRGDYQLKSVEEIMRTAEGRY